MDVDIKTLYNFIEGKYKGRNDHDGIKYILRYNEPFMMNNSTEWLLTCMTNHETFTSIDGNLNPVTLKHQASHML